MQEFDTSYVEDEEQLEKIRNSSKKPTMNILNQRDLSNWDMDDLFLDSNEEYDEDM